LERYKKIVVDANVAVKWFLPEKNYEKALKVRGLVLESKIKGFNLCTPT
jgi:predicted nucleic acid-binding protein